jgi:hypothetical protein
MKGKSMKKQVGLWIDHKKAVLVFLTDGTERTTVIESNMEKHVRFSGDSSEQGSADDIRDRQYAGHLDRFYDDVIVHIHDAESILLLGPGEAKGELRKLLEGKELGGHIVGVETVDKMTDGQIAAKVRQSFQK